MTAFNEYIKLKTETSRELTHLEVDSNFQFVANPWKEARRYKEGMIVYYGDTSTGGTGNLSWFRANQENGPSNIFDPSKWDAVGANSLTGNIFIKDSGAVLNNISLLDFSNDFIISNNGTTSHIEINPDAVGFWSSSPDDSGTIYYGSNILIGTFNVIDNTYILSVAGNQIVTGDLLVSGTINNINITDLVGDYSIHNHTLVPNTLNNYESLYPTANGALADVNININTLIDGDILSWDNSIKRWVNKIPEALLHTLSSHTDVASTVSSVPLNDQIIRYNISTLKWENITIVQDNSFGFSTTPFAHLHDSRYWTKSQLLGSSGPIINYENIFGAPATDAPIDASYVVIGLNSSLTNERVLTNGTGISIIDSGINAPVTLSVISKTTHQNIELAVDNITIGIRSRINFVTPISGNIVFTATDSLLNDVVNVEIDVVPPVSSVNGFTGNVSLGLAEMEDVIIVPSLFPGVGVGSPLHPQSNILVYDDDIAKWVNVQASSLIAAISGIFLNDILDVEIQSTGGIFDKDILYYDEASNLWLNGSVSNIDLYTATELNSGQLNVLYYTKTELNTPLGGGQVDWLNLTSVPSLAPAVHSHYLYEMVDIEDYSVVPPDPGDVLTWNDSLQIWQPMANIDPALATIINNYSGLGTYTSSVDQTIMPSSIIPLRFQSDLGIFLETDITNNIIKIGTIVDNTTIGYNTVGELIFLGEFNNVNGTINRISYFDTPTSLTDSYLLQTVNGILIDAGKRIFSTTDNNLSIDTNGRRLYDSAANTTLFWDFCLLYDNAGIISIDWDGRGLIDNNEISSINWQSRGLSDADGISSINWHGRGLIDNNEISSINWQSRNLYDASGILAGNWNNRRLHKDLDIIIDWDVYTLSEVNGLSVNWQSRRLYDETGGTTSLNWDARGLYDISGTLAVDWMNRYLKDSAGNTSVGWDNYTLNNSGGTGVVAWESLLLYDGTDTLSVNWGARTLNNSSSGIAVVEWDSGILSDASAIGSIGWQNRELYDNSGQMAINWSDVGEVKFAAKILANGGLDVTATGASDVLYIGTGNADIINIGRVGATVNILGAVLNEYATNAYVTDKLVTYNSGGGAATGIGVGFEIEENAVITGYFKTNGTRDGFVFKSPNSEIFSLDLSGLTAQRTGTIQDSAGTFAWLSDITSSVSGTTDRIPVFTGTNTIGDSYLLQNATSILIDSGKIIKSSGSISRFDLQDSYIDLNFASDYSKGWLYFDSSSVELAFNYPNSASIRITGGFVDIDSGTAGTNPGTLLRSNGKNTFFAIEDTSILFTFDSIVGIQTNTLTEVNMNSVNKDNAVFINSNGGHFPIGLFNSVIIGGTNIDAKSNNTLYTQQLGYSLVGSLNETLLSFTAPTANRAITFPNLSGMLALINGGQTFTSAVWQGTAIADGYLAESYIKANGTIPLTGNWNAGLFDIKARNFTTSGTAGTGFLDINSQSANITPGAANSVRIWSRAGTLAFTPEADGFYRLLDGTMTGNRIYELPDQNGTISLIDNPLSQFAATTSAQLAGVISDETGTGSLVFGTSPTLSNPTINNDITHTGIIGSYTGSQSITSQDGVQTTNATLTQVVAIALSNGEMISIEARINGFQSDFSNAYGSKLFAVFKKTGGVVSQVSTTDVIEKSDFTPAVDTSIEIDGTSGIEINVKGLAATTINWVTTYSYNKTLTNS